MVCHDAFQANGANFDLGRPLKDLQGVTPDGRICGKQWQGDTKDTGAAENADDGARRSLLFSPKTHSTGDEDVSISRNARPCVKALYRRLYGEGRAEPYMDFEAARKPIT